MTGKLNHKNGEPFRASQVFVISFLGFSARTARDAPLRNRFGKWIEKSSFWLEKWIFSARSIHTQRRK